MPAALWTTLALQDPLASLPRTPSFQKISPRAPGSRNNRCWDPLPPPYRARDLRAAPVPVTHAKMLGLALISARTPLQTCPRHTAATPTPQCQPRDLRPALSTAPPRPRRPAAPPPLPSSPRAPPRAQASPRALYPRPQPLRRRNFAKDRTPVSNPVSRFLAAGDPRTTLTPAAPSQPCRESNQGVQMLGAPPQ